MGSDERLDVLDARTAERGIDQERYGESYPLAA